MLTSQSIHSNSLNVNNKIHKLCLLSCKVTIVIREQWRTFSSIVGVFRTLCSQSDSYWLLKLKRQHTLDLPQTVFKAAVNISSKPYNKRWNVQSSQESDSCPRAIIGYGHSSTLKIILMKSLNDPNLFNTYNLYLSIPKHFKPIKICYYVNVFRISF